MTEKLANYDGPERPPDAFSIDAILDYRRLDDTRLTIFADGRFTVRDQGLITYADEFSPTQAISITNSIINSGQLNLGLATFFDEEEPTSEAAEGETSTPTPDLSPSHLLARGVDGVWDGEFGAIDVPFLDILNQLLDLYLAGGPTPTPEPTEEAPIEETPPSEETPSPESTEETTPTPETEEEATPTSNP